MASVAMEALASEAMDTLKMKIGLLTKESKESSDKMAEAAKAKAEADERINNAEKKIKELSKQIHARKILLDEHTDKVVRNSSLAKRKEEAALAAREEIRAQTLREMALKSEVEKVASALPKTQAQLTVASERADSQLAEVKRLEIRAMLTDQTIEEMEQQLGDALNMSSTTAQRAEETGRKLSVRKRELGQAQDRASAAASNLELVNGKLREADRKMACIQYSLEERASQERKYKKQIGCLKEKLQHEEVRADREEESQARLQGRMEGIEARRRQRDLEKRKGK